MRDHFDRLKCPVPGCRRWIAGTTGLDEITKLRTHYWRAHLARLDTNEALELRSRLDAEEREAATAICDPALLAAVKRERGKR